MKNSSKPATVISQFVSDIDKKFTLGSDPLDYVIFT